MAPRLLPDHSSSRKLRHRNLHCRVIVGIDHFGQAQKRSCEFNLMSRFEVNLQDSNASEAKKEEPPVNEPIFGNFQAPKQAGKSTSKLKIAGISILVFLLIVLFGGYLYFRSFRTTPQYSLAMVVDAARRDDQATIDELIDTDAIVDDFMPQITDKAIELYGRGLPPGVIQKVAQVAAPMIPAVKQRARAEVPNMVREKTKPFENVPFWAIVVGASRYLEISQEADKATIKSKLADRPLELTMKRNGERWKIIGIKDEVLARKVAEKIGQELILKAKKIGAKKTGEELGVGNIDDILKNNEIFK